MSSKLRISEILIKNYRQFRNFRLDLTDPSTGQPLDKICLIGANGTGKSTLLALLSQFLQTAQLGSPLQVGGYLPPHATLYSQPALFCVRCSRLLNEYYLVCVVTNLMPPTVEQFLVSADIEKSADWQTMWNSGKTLEKLQPFLHFLQQRSQNNLIQQFTLQPDSKDLAIYAPPDGSSLLRNSVLPNTTLSNALGLFTQLPAFHIVAYEQLEGFWNTLIYQIKKRESDYQQFLKTPEIQKLSVAEAHQKFEKDHPEILKELAEQWNLILEQAGLEFDLENAKIPVQLNENLQAYIRFKATQTQIPYNVLSTGVRNFIFRFGHIYALYFNRTIERGFLLIDEPEASLFPDLLYDIIERYLSIIQNTQFFVATHNPIIAGQFRPCERFILTFDEQGYVEAKRGVSAEGDDPNDLLMNDFMVRSLYGKKGIEQWKRYRELRRQIPKVTDPKEKKALLDEYTKIGNAYNFASHEVLT